MVDGKPSLLMFSALSAPPFRSVKLRARRASCPACGEEGEKIGQIEETDYVAFCCGERPDWVSRGLVVEDPQKRIRAKVRGLEFDFHSCGSPETTPGTQERPRASTAHGENPRCTPTYRIRHLSLAWLYQ